MQKNRSHLLVLINTVSLIFLICFLIFRFFFISQKTVYVDNVKLFDGFYMTKEMKQVGEKQFTARKTILDSLYAKLQSDKISDSEKKGLMQVFIKGKEELELFNQNFAAEETSKIWSRIHGYVDEFSKENNYQLILGSENKQTVLYADENHDITNELLLYINKKYEGVK